MAHSNEPTLIKVLFTEVKVVDSFSIFLKKLFYVKFKNKIKKKNIFSAFVSFLEVFTEFVTILFLFHVSVFWPGGMWDLSCLTRDEPTPPHWKAKS